MTLPHCIKMLLLAASMPDPVIRGMSDAYYIHTYLL